VGGAGVFSQKIASVANRLPLPMATQNVYKTITYIPVARLATTFTKNRNN
jgi:hypothetical protein